MTNKDYTIHRPAASFASPAILAWRASTETRNFSFEGFGSTEDAALEQIEKLLDLHGEQYHLSSDWWKYPNEGACVITVAPLHEGGYRDGEQLR